MSPLSIEVWYFIFKYLRYIDLIEVSAVCKEWNMIIQKGKLISKLKESQIIFTDRDWHMKSYKKNLDRFWNDMYWEIINYLSLEKIQVLKREVYDRIFYSVFPFVSGIIYGHVVGLSLILVYVSFALSFKLWIKKSLNRLIKTWN